MAKCPNCGRRLTIFDWRPNCPGCGVNLVYFGREERLMNEADAAEAEHAKLQKHLDRLKASFVGSPLAIVRIVLSVLPIAALMLPLCKVAFNGPFIPETVKSINAIGIYNLVSSLDFDALFTMIGSSLLDSAFIGYAVSLVCLLLSLVVLIVSLVLLTMACGPKGNVRNITLNCIDIVLAVVSVIFFGRFSSGIQAVFPDFVTGASVQYGAYVYIAALVILLAINIIIAKKGVPVKYKQCYVGGIPSDEYFELVAAGTDVETIHEMMAEAMAKAGYEDEAVPAEEETAEKEEVNA